MHYPREFRAGVNCKCPLHIEGWIGGEEIRQSLQTVSYGEAEKVRDEALRRGTWKAEVQSAEIIDIAAASAGFLADAKARHLKLETLKKYRVLLSQLLDFEHVL